MDAQQLEQTSPADNLHRWLIIAISPNQERIQFYVSATSGFEAMGEASGHPDCADVTALQRVEETHRPRLPRVSWLEGMITR
jgi:hypothetical protein